MSVEVRRWLYGVAVAALAVLFAYGVVDVDKLGVWTALAAALLVPVPVVALAHTPRRRAPDDAPAPRRAADDA